MNTSRGFRFIAPAVLAISIGFAGHAIADAEARALEEWYATALAKAEEPVANLRTKYLENLDAWKLAEQEKGMLEAVLAAQTEIDTVTLAKERNLQKWPGLQRLRSIYDTTMAKLEPELRTERQRLHRLYRERLQQQVERLTREGQLDEAKRLSTKMFEINKLLEQGAGEGEIPAGAGVGTVLWEFKSRASVKPVREVEIKTGSNAFFLTSPRKDSAYFESRRSFKPPFRVQARVSTDSTNIRFYYNSRVLTIFNWEMNPAELRIHEPATGRNMGFGNKGQLTPHDMHDIEIDVRSDRIEVKADGELRAVAAVGNNGLDAPVGIGPAFNSVVTVEMMRVLELTGE